MKGSEVYPVHLPGLMEPDLPASDLKSQPERHNAENTDSKRAGRSDRKW
jgi:hypothetical protein